jgi:16S rRNA (uracil1498-N3)-methyltransferase
VSRKPRLLRVPLHPLDSGDVALGEATARYVSRVHRLRDGDRFVAFDPEACTEADVEILSASREVRCRVGPLRTATNVVRTGLTLLQVMGKGDKPEQVIRDATVLGAERVVLLESSRGVVHVPEARAESRRTRWHSVALEAARQSGRGDVPAVDGPLSFDAALAVAAAAPAHRLVLLPGAAVGLWRALGDWKRGSPAFVLIGPEGGFDAEEEERAVAAGFVPVSLGPLVLRTETAAVAALAIVAAAALEREPE